MCTISTRIGTEKCPFWSAVEPGFNLIYAPSPRGNEGFKDRQIFVKKNTENRNGQFGCMILTFFGQKYKSVIPYFPTEISDLIQIRPIFG